jgi:uncharacterized RDD family membrane protein YckC
VNRPPERSAFAGFSRRLAAGLIDSLIVLAALWVTFIVRAALGDPDAGAALTLASIVLVPLLYFGLLWPRKGQTLGMRAVEIRLVSTDTWEPPSRARASFRAFVAVVTFAAWLLPLVAAFSDGNTTAANAIIVVGLAIAVVALIGHLSALRDPSSQSIQDRLFGLAVVLAEPSGQRSQPGEPALSVPLSGRSE